MSEQVFDGFQEFVEACKQVDEWRAIDGADWDEEIGALREVTGELIPDPLPEGEGASRAPGEGG